MTGGVVGVVGTLVWDRIVPADGSAPAEGWGGIGYALAGMRASLPAGWSARPVIRVGQDLHQAAREVLASDGFPVDAVVAVPQRTNRVELRYHDAAERTEVLDGGVSPWDTTGLLEHLCGCDALYVNFISGHELELETLEAVRRAFDGPVYGDLHSLFLGRDADGVRTPRTLPAWSRWISAFDAVQMNERELGLLLDSAPRGWLTRNGEGTRPGLVAITRGGEGARVVHRPGLPVDPMLWRGIAPDAQEPPPRVTKGRGPSRNGDPTGSGDVWGATFFARLLAGDGVERSLFVANERAGRSLGHHGCVGLADHLALEASHVEKTR